MNANALKVEFICGGSFDKDGAQMDWPLIQSAMEMVEAQLLADFGAFSKVKSFSGKFNLATKDLIKDQSVVYTVIVPLDTPEIELHAARACCLGAFNQTSVPMCVTQVYSQ